MKTLMVLIRGRSEGGLRAFATDAWLNVEWKKLEDKKKTKQKFTWERKIVEDEKLLPERRSES